MGRTACDSGKLFEKERGKWIGVSRVLVNSNMLLRECRDFGGAWWYLLWGRAEALTPAGGGETGWLIEGVRRVIVWVRMSEEKKWRSRDPVFPDGVCGISKYTWICPDCRCSVRRSIHDAESPRCSSCAGPMVWFGTKNEVPRRNNAKAWNQLREYYRERPDGE
ncbi:MAG: hypothetical protein CMO55_14765 [Verrucomicrobiales bacterium]|nr:hypothetical protein [Verrucomicrobiales bacterium]